MIELLSPSQIGPASTRMSAAFTFSKIAGQSSVSQPCSRHVGPDAGGDVVVDRADDLDLRRRAASMMCRLTSTSPWVLLGSGDRFSVQLMNSAFRSA